MNCAALARRANRRYASRVMGYRVRNQHGELHLKDFSELKDAWLTQMVGPEDEVCEDGSTHWQKAGSLPRLQALQRSQPSAWQREGRWYLLAAALVAAFAYFVVKGWTMVSFAIVAVLIAGFLTWTTFASFKRRR